MEGLKMLSVFIIYSWHVYSIMCLRSGPFKSSYTRVEPCPNPTLPVDTDPPAIFIAELYNSSTDFNLMKGKVAVLRDHRVKKMKARSYLWDNNKWKVNYMINSMGCNRAFFPVLVLAAGVKYDAKNCTFFKGEYNFNDLNINKVQHVWMKSQEYGRLLWKLELFSNAGTFFCWEFETLIVPA